MHIWGKGRRAFLEFINRVIWSSALHGAIYLFDKLGVNDLTGQLVMAGLGAVWVAVLLISIREYWDDLAHALPPEAIELRRRQAVSPRGW